MKPAKRNILLALFSFILFLTYSCKKDNQDTIVTMTVAAKTIKATVGGTTGATDRLNGQGEGGTWAAVYSGQSGGWEGGEGYEYVLKVKKQNRKSTAGWLLNTFFTR